MPVYTGVNTRDPFSRKCCVTPREKSETLTRVEDSERVEGSLDRSVQLHAVLTELEREPATLENADAVLSGQSSAEFESTPEDLVRGGPHGFGDRAVGSAVEDEGRMDVAVTSMRDSHDLDHVLGGRSVDTLEHVGQFRPRDPDVFHETLPESFGSRIGESANLE